MRRLDWSRAALGGIFSEHAHFVSELAFGFRFLDLCASPPGFSPNGARPRLGGESYGFDIFDGTVNLRHQCCGGVTCIFTALAMGIGAHVRPGTLR